MVCKMVKEDRSVRFELGIYVKVSFARQKFTSFTCSH